MSSGSKNTVHPIFGPKLCIEHSTQRSSSEFPSCYNFSHLTILSLSWRARFRKKSEGEVFVLEDVDHSLSLPPAATESFAHFKMSSSVTAFPPNLKLTQDLDRMVSHELHNGQASFWWRPQCPVPMPKESSFAVQPKRRNDRNLLNLLGFIQRSSRTLPGSYVIHDLEKHNSIDKSIIQMVQETPSTQRVHP